MKKLRHCRHYLSQTHRASVEVSYKVHAMFYVGWILLNCCAMVRRIAPKRLATSRWPWRYVRTPCVSWEVLQQNSNVIIIKYILWSCNEKECDEKHRWRYVIITCVVCNFAMQCRYYAKNSLRKVQIKIVYKLSCASKQIRYKCVKLSYIVNRSRVSCSGKMEEMLR